jgi:ABC-type multidrug transport system fused ATPase/permease subunit
MCTVLTLLIVGQVVGLGVTGVGLRLTVTSAQQGSRTHLLVATLIAVAGIGLSWAGATVVQMLRTDLSDRIGYLQLDPEIQRFAADPEGLAHLERSDYLDRLALLRDRAQMLADAAWGTVELAGLAIQVVVMLAVLTTVHPVLAGLALAALPGVLLGGKGQRYLLNAFMASANSVRLERHLHEIATRARAGKEIRVCGAAGTLIALADDSWAHASRSQAAGHLRAVLLDGVSATVFLLGYAGTLVYLVVLVGRGERGIGDLILVLTLAGQVRLAFGYAIRKRAEVQFGLSLAEPYRWLRDYARDHGQNRISGTPAPMSMTDGITLREVTFQYPNADRPALGPLTVHLPAGSVVALVGEYGSGKSTLVKLLGKFYQPTAGQIEVDGVPLTDVDTASWRSGSTAAFQDFARYDATLRQAVGFADLSAVDDDDRLLTALADAGGADLPGRLPHGLDTQLGSDLDLSEGQWQKTALARACLPSAPVLAVLDEPTASLDAPSEHETFVRHARLARRLAERHGTITLVVSHRFSTVRMADLILVLHQGRLVEQGTHQELVALGGHYADLYQLQATAYQPSGGVRNRAAVGTESLA